MIDTYDISLGGHDFAVTIETNDRLDAVADGDVIRISQYDDETGELREVSVKVLDAAQSQELRARLKEIAEREQSLRRYYAPEEDADRAYDDSI